MAENFTERALDNLRERHVSAAKKLALSIQEDAGYILRDLEADPRSIPYHSLVNDAVELARRIAALEAFRDTSEIYAAGAAPGEGRREQAEASISRSVSATLRTAGFRAIGDGDEGYEVGPFGGPGSGIVHVTFHSYLGDGSGAAVDAALAFEQEALASMTATLRNKGWAAEPSVPPAYLIVTEAGQ